MMNFTWRDYNLLELIEMLAEHEGMISSEEELSERFDDELLIIEVESDKPMLRQAFNDWSDGLFKNGELHEEQYNNYEYVGKYRE